MAAHLARHQSAVHGMGGKKRKRGRVGRPPGKRGPGRPRGRRAGASPSSGGNFGEAASRILVEMSSYRDQLVAQRESINTQLAGIENAMNAMGTRSSSMVVPGRPRRGRPKGSGGRENSLKPMIVRVLRQRGSIMTPQEISDAVVRAGYSSRSDNLTKAVSNALPLIREIKKIGRGQYSA